MSITKGYTFGATEQVTNAKLHTMVDSASIADIVNANIGTGAAIEETKIAFDGSTVVTLSDTQTITGDKTFTGTLDFSGATITTLLEIIYPVGSLYFNGEVATNPATLLGFGTWVAACEGRQPVGFKATDTDYDTVLEQSGSKTSTALIAHTHSTQFGNGSAGGGQDVPSIDVNNTLSGSVTTTSAGSGSSFSIMNPVETYYIWRRTA